MRIIHGLWAGLRYVLPIAVLLLVTAGLAPGGTWLWPRGLWFVGVYGAISIASSTALAVFRPAHFEVRQQGVVAPADRKQPLIDAVGTAILIAYALGWLAFIPIDVFDLHLLPAPSFEVAAAGGLCALAGAALNHFAVWQNEFAAPNVQDQTAWGQRVIDTGVYSVVRHPIYASNLLLFAGAAIWLGSYAALIGVSLILAATIGRIIVEEGQLRANLPGYGEYARRVRGRLIPFVL